MGFTDKQQEVVDHRSGSLLVSAAAGSGKTSTLVAHVAKRIREGGDLGRLLIVTYTRTAAAEMRERIRLALEQALNEAPENRHLRHQLAILGQARIQTVDSFCNRLVRSYFQEIDGLTPDVRIAEEAEIKLLSRDVMEEVLAEAYREASPDFYALLDGYSSEKNHDDITELVLALYDSSQNAPFPRVWLENALPDFPKTEEALRQTPWLKAAAENTRRVIFALGEKQDELLRELEEEPAEHAALLTQLKEERKLTKDWEQLTDYYQLQDAVRAFRTPAFGRKELKQDPSYQYVKDVRGTVTSGGYYKLLDALRKGPLVSPAEEVRLLGLTEAPGRALIALTLNFADKLGEACRKRGIATFMDMEHYALELLMERDPEGRIVPTKLATELRKDFDEIIVDEYQDINQVQEYILRGLSGEDAGRPNLFMVGDVKQSIYRFRRADPTIFMRKYAAFSEEKAAPHRKILLQDNFRSRAAVLESANRVFARLMRTDFGGVDYDADAALHAAGSFTGPDPETRLLLLQTEAGASQRLKEEGRLIAVTILGLMKEKRQIREKQPDGTLKLRDLSYGDIVILNRGRKAGGVLSRILKSYGIPAAAQETKGFYDTLEVQTLLSLLAVLDNPRQDIPLGAVLLSPIGGFSQEELAEAVRGAADAEEALIDRLKRLPETVLGGRMACFLEKLDGWREAAGLRSVPELLEYLLRESGYDCYLQAMPSGPVRLANLRQLKEMAASYEESSYKGLYQFLRYVERQKDLQLDVGEAPLISDGTDVVRIGTLHSSKGLEYPVVILAGLGRKFNESDLSAPVLIHTDCGLALTSCDSEALMKYPNLWRRFVAEQIRREGRSEELRLLYVGMTRAVEQLILVGSLKKDAEEEIERQSGKEPEEADTFLSWLLQCRAAGDDLGMRWEFCRPEDLPTPEEEAFGAQLSRWEQAKKSGPGAPTALKRELEWSYPYPQLPKLSYSVSELKQKAAGAAAEPAPEETERLRPRLSAAGEEEDAEALSAAEKGTAFHKLMEHIPPERSASPEQVSAYIQEAVRAGILSPAQAEALDPEAVSCFYGQPVGRRALAAAAKGKMRREKPFILGIPYAELDPESPLTETVLVQGIIDLYFEEEGKLVLIDYKTDRVRDQAELIRRYKTQLRWYSRALSAALEKPVGEIWLYSTVLKRFVSLPL